MKTITTDELKSRLDAGPVALFDVRGDVEYDQKHIPGAKSAPLGSLVFRVASIMNPDSEVIVYANGDDDLAAQAAERLESLKMKNIFAYQEGLEGWQKAGRDTVSSTRVREHTWGPVKEIRPVVVDRENAYSGAFKGKPADVEGAGG